VSAALPPAQGARLLDHHERRVWHSRRVFDHVTMRVSDPEASARFCGLVLSTERLVGVALLAAGVYIIVSD
jgi:hypothetical protein